ncbi:hypothetical protein Tco_0636372 [Tanacetum coccineum]
MVVQNQSQIGEGSSNPTDPHHTPTIIQPSTQPQKTQKHRKPRKDTQVPQSSDPTRSVADEVVHKELGDSLVRVVTTASSLEAEQDSGNINKAQSKATPNESSSLGTTSSGGPRCQETIRDTIAQTRVKSTDKKKLVRDAAKQGGIDAIDADEEITLVNVQNVDEEMFDVNVLDGEEVFVAEQEVVANKENDEVNVVEEVVQVSDAGNVISTAGGATTVSAVTTTTGDDGDITLAQALIEMKSKGILIEPVKPIKKKDLIRLDEEVDLKLQAEFDEEERLLREKAKKEKEANIALIETWDDIQAKIDVDHQLAERFQAQEQEELSIEEKAALFQQRAKRKRISILTLIKETKEKRNKPPTKALQR